jgi:cytochrome oxidase Cu insertion factor (SCO1/SenC/PrrC family)
MNKHLAILILFTYSFFGFSQPEARPSGPRGSPGGPASVGLEVGMPFPEKSVYDAEGKPFELSRLRGNYSVLVFGCLT